MDNNSKLFILLLEEIRLEKGISRYSIAKDSGLNEMTVKRILDLENEPSLSNFLKIAKVLEVNFFFETKNSNTQLNKCFENAMEKLGRRTDKLNRN